MRTRAFLGLLSIFVLASLVWTAEPVPVLVAHGKVEKADKDSVTFQARDDTGKFGKAVTLQITGTSKVIVLAMQVRDKKLVATQKEADFKAFTAGEMIAVIYALPKGQDPILLSVVVEPSEK